MPVRPETSGSGAESSRCLAITNTVTALSRDGSGGGPLKGE
jgi:hypothetical protein